MPEPHVPTVFLDRLKEARISVSLSVLGAFIVTAYFTGIEINAAYVEFHRDLAHDEAAKVVLAQTETVRQQIQQQQQTAEETSRKLDQVAAQIDGLTVFLASESVRGLQQQLDVHEATPENTPAWRRERDRLRNELRIAVEYRDCLRRSELNCEHLRGW